MKEVKETVLRTRPCMCVCNIDNFKSGCYYPMIPLPSSGGAIIYEPIRNHYKPKTLPFSTYVQHFFSLPSAVRLKILKLKDLLFYRFRIKIETYVAYSEDDDSFAYYYRLFDRFDRHMVTWANKKYTILTAEIHGIHENKYFSSEEVALKHALKTAKHFLLRSYNKTDVLKSIFCGLDFDKKIERYIIIHRKELKFD
jgi:hypothetical protein